ncbi:MAG TPA: amidohydrolase family protein [Thermoanaerobaculia bacterium]|nr:amidohydrolase family protein [Thermoanaerobaculia bacterium]
MLRALLTLVLVLAAAAAADANGPPAGDAAAAADVAAARALFERNLDAIRRRDRDAYLACYLPSPDLARTGQGGLTLGYEGLAASTGEGWPDAFDAQDLRLVRVQPGVVYGTYRYRVRYGADEQTGLSERLFVRSTPEDWKIAVTTAFGAPPGTAPPPRALVGGTLVDGSGAPPVREAVVLLRDGKIECAGARAACPVPADVGATDVSGHWITPGLIDTHVHLSQTGWADGRPDALDVRDRHPYERVQAELRAHPERLLRSQLCSGVTAVFDVGGYPWTLGLRERVEARTDLPRLAAAGPLLSTIDHWLNLPGERQFTPIPDAETARAAVRDLAARGADAVKVWYIVGAPADVAKFEPIVAAAGAEARARDLPLIVHATGLAEAKAALRAGAKLLVHSVWEPIDDEFVQLAKSSGAIYSPTLTVPAGYTRLFAAAARGEAPAVDDPNGCVDPATRAKLAETASYRAAAPDAAALEARARRTAQEDQVARANLERLAAAGVPIALGTDAGNPLTLHGPAIHAELAAMEAAGLTPMQVLVAATRTAAAALGREDLGTLAPGKAADLLVLAADPTASTTAYRQLRWVARGGELRSLADLQALATTPPAEGAD